MSDAEAVRYDRQIRLWGKSTQQQLTRTSIIFDGIAGVAAEAAKNLALAGVRGIAVVDAAAVGKADEQENYLMQGESGRTRAARAVCALRRLNPYVRVCGSVAELGAGTAVVRVVAIASVDEGSACVRAATVDTASPSSVDLLVLHATLGSTVLAFVLHRKLALSCPFAEQWRRLVADPALLSSRPAAYQRVVLSLHLRNTSNSCATFAEAAATAYAQIDALHLQLLRPRDVEVVLLHGATAAATSADAVCATVAGACVAQYLIRQIGSLPQEEGEADPQSQSHRWLLCVTDSEVECLVGL